MRTILFKGALNLSPPPSLTSMIRFPFLINIRSNFFTTECFHLRKMYGKKIQFILKVKYILRNESPAETKLFSDRNE